jgi:hypothetical protein
MEDVAMILPPPRHRRWGIEASGPFDTPMHRSQGQYGVGANAMFF